MGMRGVRAWLVDDLFPESDVVWADGRYVCRESYLTDEEAKLSMIRATPEPIAVEEM